MTSYHQTHCFQFMGKYVSMTTAVKKNGNGLKMKIIKHSSYQFSLDKGKHLTTNF